MNARVTAAVLVVGMSILIPAFANDSLVTAAQTIVASTDVAPLRATVTAIHPESGSMTLRGPLGKEVAVLLPPRAAGEPSINVGKSLDVTYRSAVLMSADKVTAKQDGIRENIDTSVIVPMASGYEAARQIEMLATVKQIDRVHRKVTFRGAKQTASVSVADNFNLSDLHEGDMVHAVLVETYSVHL